MPPSSPPAPPPAQPDDRRRWAALLVLCTGMLMIVLDGTVVNVALPHIQDDLAFSQSGLAWVVNAYLIAFGGLLLLAGRLGDLLSRRDMFLAGLGVFTVASVLCGAAQSQEMLVGARFLQGIGGAMASAVILGMIVTLFPEPKEQAKAIGVFGFVASGGGSVGLLAGGVLTQALDWHWIFLINVPIGIAAAYGALRLLERDRGIGLGKGADALGAVLITASLMLLVYTIVKPAAEDGWTATPTLLLGGLGLALLAAFVARQATATQPLMPLRLFKNRNTSGANVVQALLVAGMFSVFFLGALYLQRVLGYDALQTGLAFLPSTLVMGVLSLKVSDKVQLRFGAKATLVPGLLLVSLGIALFTRAPVDGSYVTDVLPTMVLFGTGLGLAGPAVMTVAMSGASPQDAGLASGLVNTMLQVGGAIGLAVLATVSTTRSEDLRAAGDPVLEALNSGYHLAFLVGSALVALAAGVGAVVLKAAAAAPPVPGQAAAPADDAPPAFVHA